MRNADNIHSFCKYSEKNEINIVTTLEQGCRTGKFDFSGAAVLYLLKSVMYGFLYDFYNIFMLPADRYDESVH